MIFFIFFLYDYLMEFQGGIIYCIRIKCKATHKILIYHLVYKYVKYPIIILNIYISFCFVDILVWYIMPEIFTIIHIFKKEKKRAKKRANILYQMFKTSKETNKGGGGIRL